MPIEMNRRLSVVAFIITLVSLGLIGQLVLLQYRLDPEVAALIEQNAGVNEGQPVKIQPNRGNIYDRHGRTLAVNRLEYRVGISPAAVSAVEREAVAKQLARLLDLNELDLLELLRPNAEGIYENQYLPLKSFVPLAVGEELEALDIPGLVLDPMYLREYPHGDLTDQILGFVNYVEEQGDAQTTGFWGVEAYYQSELAGQSKIRVESTIPLDFEDNGEVRDGQELYLTIDLDVQWVAQNVLETFIKEEQEQYGDQSKVQGGTIIVMNPRTGEILAMVSYPYFDSDSYKAFPQDEKPIYNPAISASYEPGSIFKIITASIALDVQEPGLDLNWSYTNLGCEFLAGVQICDSERQPKNTRTFSQCLIQSLNTCTVHWVEIINRSRWYSYLEAFGFGRKTEVDLNGEVEGLVVYPWSPEWSEANFLQTSFGQGIAVTPLQMLTAANAVANDGIIMQPYIVKARQEGDTLIETVPTRISRPVSAASAQQVLNLMKQAVYDDEGFGGQAEIDNYNVAGKTGTAQKPDAIYGYSETDSWASFIGFLPADNPQLSVLVVLDNPKDYWGSQTAAPLFSELVSQLVVLLEIPPNDVLPELINAGGHPFERE